MIKIGDVVLDNHIIVGPMAGISNYSFRSIIKQFNPALIYSEMISDKAICYETKKTIPNMEMLNKMLKLYDAKFSKFEYSAKDNALVLN